MNTIPATVLADCATCRIVQGDSWQPTTQPSPALSNNRPTAPAVSDSQRPTRQGIRSIYVQNRRDNYPRRAVFFADGRYIDDESSGINIALRDHHSGEVADMRRRLLDIMWLTHQRLDLPNEPYFLVSPYRSPATNARLRRESLVRNGGTTGVALHSPHMDAIACDVRLHGRSTRQIHRATLSASAELGYGGVGLYTRDGFVHMDGNRSRRWGA